MLLRLLTLGLLMAFTTVASAKDVYLSVGGSVGNFRTDARIFNPSFNKDITVTALYLPFGNIDNSNVVPKTITIPRRSMAVYDDVVQSLFGGGAILGAVRLTSDDDFVATQRIYADEAIGTLGQFVPGLERAQALSKGVVIQLKQNGASGARGTFRTNLGAVNPNPMVANIKFTLHDRTNGVAGTNDLTLQPFGVFSPTSIAAFFGNPNRNLTDAWFSFVSDQPVFVYGSVLDNGSQDPTFIPAFADSGVAPLQPQAKNVEVTARNWEFDVVMSSPLRAGDVARFRISAVESAHGFTLISPTGQRVIPDVQFSGAMVIEREVILPVSGTYTFFCTLSCGEGHTSMRGTLSVAN